MSVLREDKLTLISLEVAECLQEENLPIVAPDLLALHLQISLGTAGSISTSERAANSGADAGKEAS